MEDAVVCPNCGEQNPADMPFCQHCQWRLRTLEAEWGTDQEVRPSNAPASPQRDKSEDASVPDWLRASRSQASHDSAAFGGRLEAGRQPAAPPSDDDLLAGLAQQDQPQDEEIPDWVARIVGMSESGSPGQAPSSENESELLEGAPPADQAPSAEHGIGQEESQSWARDSLPLATDIGPQEGANRYADAMGTQESGTEKSEINEWLRNLDAAAAASPEPPPGPGLSASENVPTWVRRMTGVPDGQPQETPGPADPVPDWLSGSPGRSGEPVSAPPSSLGIPTRSQGRPLEATDKASGEAPAQSATSAAISRGVVPAFPLEDIQKLDVDAVFASMQMPVWMAGVNPPEATSVSDLPPAAQEEEPIAPADLPSWVRAMRPVVSGVDQAAKLEADKHLEGRGPLLGLQGVLPALPGAALPSGRPESHSMKLDVSERHQAHARLLESMIAAETQPLPLQGTGQFRSHRMLRWAISAILVVGLGANVLTGARNFPLPAGVPNESIAGIQAVESLPPDATVLAVFDYEPATVGEMEATAASLMHHLLLLKHPRLAVISTSPTGSALAGRFLAGALADRAYMRGVHYVDLGYLPGGLAGVRSFAQNPTAAVPLGASSEQVWDSSVLLGTRRLSDFAAIILLTDSLESGRVWIEQTAATRGTSPLVMVASAQAGPMLLPYFDSGQADGLIAGLNGAAGAEIANNGLPGLVRRYWDAYSLGLYLAALLITLGSTWHVGIGIRERRAETA